MLEGLRLEVEVQILVATIESRVSEVKRSEPLVHSDTTEALMKIAWAENDHGDHALHFGTLPNVPRILASCLNSTTWAMKGCRKQKAVEQRTECKIACTSHNHGEPATKRCA